ncbi:MAG: proline racemase family protein [Phycisphaerales bacterium]
MSEQPIAVIDSHTEGEPTRVVIEGGPDLGSGPLAQRVRLFRDRFDHVRSAVCNEPRGNDAMVGALLVPPTNPRAVTGVIFFNNVGYLNMCVHGTIGVGATLAHMGLIGPGSHVLESPVGDVTISLGDDAPDVPAGSIGQVRDAGQGSWNPNRVTVTNVHSFRHRKQVPITLDGGQTVHGDIAWGGNWFFLVDDHGADLSMQNLERLTSLSWQIRLALDRAGVKGDPAFGAGGGDIDHIELFGPPTRPDCHSKNFVLCPGKAYDRSPCGTGTSAKLACLFADGKLGPGQVWRQESIIGSAFSARVRPHDAGVIPVITGQAFITAQSTLVLDPNDPLRDGIRG